MRDIGDVYLQLVVSVWKRSNVYRVVEIARRLAVNCDDGKIAEIAAGAQIRTGHLLRRGVRFGKRSIREHMRQMMLPDNNFDVHANLTGASQDFDDASGGREATLRITGKLHIYDSAVELRQPHATRGHVFARPGAYFLAQDRSELFARGARYFMKNASVVRLNMIALRAVAEDADNRGILAFNDLDDAAFRAAVRTTPLDARKDVIPVHRVVECVAANEEVAIHTWNRLVGHQKGVTIAMGNDSAGD